MKIFEILEESFKCFKVAQIVMVFILVVIFVLNVFLLSKIEDVGVARRQEVEMAKKEIKEYAFTCLTRYGSNEFNDMRISALSDYLGIEFVYEPEKWHIEAIPKAIKKRDLFFTISKSTTLSNGEDLRHLLKLPKKGVIE